MFMRKPFGFFRRIREHPFALIRKRQIDRSRHFLPNRRMPFNLLAYRLHRRMRPQKAIRQRLVLPQQPEQKMFSLDIRRPKLTSLITSKKDYPPRFFRIAFEHVIPFKPDTIQP
jgi:hypothetical protein